MRWFGILALLAALTACSDSSDSALPPTTTPPTSTLVAAPVTTPAPTTTTTTEDPDIAAVREAHQAFLEMFEVVGDPPNPDHPELARRATGDAYERLRANLQQDQLLGHRLIGGWESHPLTIEVSGTEATVEDCLLDAIEVVDGSGATVVAADTEPFVSTVHLRLESDGWKVWRLDTDQNPVPCNG